MLSKDQIWELVQKMESDNIERTVSTTNTDKFGQAICAFSNDFYNRKENGFLLLGVNDKNCKLANLKVTDQLLLNIAAIKTDGNILPPPQMEVYHYSYTDGDILVVEVSPDKQPPVRYKGQTWIRIGPRKVIASEADERQLMEKRVSHALHFDQRPCYEATIQDLDLEYIKNEYFPRAIDSEVLKHDNRDIKEQLASLRFYDLQTDHPTNAAVILFGKNIAYNFPGAYVQYVKYNGIDVSFEILSDKEFKKNILRLVEQLDLFIETTIIEQRPIPVSSLKESNIYNYPEWAIRELLMNAIMHRDYQSNAPIKFYQFEDRLLIENPGGLYGNANLQNFPSVSDYRNPVIAEAMKVMGYVNKFTRGIATAKRRIEENGNPTPEFKIDISNTFGVNVFKKKDEIVQEAKGTIISDGSLQKQKIRLGNTEQRIFDLLKDNPNLTYGEISNIMGVTKKTVNNNVNKLIDKKYISRVGNKQTGHWQILL